MKLAILLTVHNRKEKTLNCLRNLENQMSVDGWLIEIFLTDDGCTDGTREAVAQEFPTIHIIDGDGNLYWNRGMRAAWNAALKYDDFDAFLWLNDDTFLYDDSIKSILKIHCENPSKIVVGSTKSSKSNKITYGGYDRSEGLIEPNGTLQECNSFNGNVVLIPRDAFIRVGNLDPVYTHSLGDIDYGLTASKLGIKSVVLGHFVGCCERNSTNPKWTRSEVPFVERWKNLFTPLSYSNPPEYFHFKRKHWGLMIAILAMFSTILHVISPKLWKRVKR